jgi:UDP-N-acetylglucosamine--N-acetylmuramyl-(pentapeptide) pyrophosphoryl-undecaprenol N-acetylglucosamine transferase
MRTLLVASTGGHLAQLHSLAPRFADIDLEASTWVTFDTPQSRSMLAGRSVVYVPYTAPRDWRNVARNARRANALLRSSELDRVVSTGSAIALSFIPLARRHGVAATYLESAARSTGPSLTGRLLSCVPGVELANQWPAWADGRWRYAGSVLDAFAVAPPARPKPIERVLVTLGTIPYPFQRLIDRMRAIVPADVDVTWQTGATPAEGLGDRAHTTLSGRDFAAAVAAADVIVAHAGTGSAIAALEQGKCPVMVPREQAHGEHVDDHQRQIAEELETRGLGACRPVQSLDWELLERMARRGGEVGERRRERCPLSPVQRPTRLRSSSAGREPLSSGTAARSPDSPGRGRSVERTAEPSACSA